MATRRTRRNPPLPSAPPKRRFQGAPATTPQDRSALARVRRIAGSVDERERPFNPERPGSWRGSSRDLVVNARQVNTRLKLQPGYAYWFSADGDWEDSPDDDWDTVVIGEDEVRAGKHTGRRLIDGAMCNVFVDPKTLRTYAQTRAMTGNPSVDPRDIPAHLRKAEINREPEHNGQDIGYSQGYRSREEPGWYQVEYATGSDYSGGSVHESNYQVLGEMLEEHHPEDAEPVVWARTSGGHGTYGIVVRYGDLEDEVREAIDALEDYPLMDEEHHSQLEMEQQNEAWDDWARKDFIKAVAKLEGKDRSALEDAITSDQWYGVFNAMMTSANANWEDQQGAGQYIDVDKLAEELTPFIESGEFPKYSSDHDDDALQALYDALPSVEEE